METKAQEAFEDFKLANKEYLALEKAANEEIKMNESVYQDGIISEIVKAGYSGKATKEDWLRLFKNNGDLIFGNNVNNLSAELAGNINEFIAWWKKYEKKTK
jgi:hypothetical protein